MRRSLLTALLLLCLAPSLACAQFLSPDSRARPRNLGSPTAENMYLTRWLYIYPSAQTAVNPTSGLIFAPTNALNSSIIFGAYAITSFYTGSEYDVVVGAPTSFIVRFTSSGFSATSGSTGGLVLASAIGMGWTSAASATNSVDTALYRCGVACIKQGIADAASPVAQVSSVQNVVAGTAATAGADRTFNGSQGTYTGAGGGQSFQVAPAALSDSAHSITAFSGTTSPYTITATGAPAYPVGTIVTVASATPSSLNGSYTVTSSSAGQFTATTTQTGTWSSGGTAAINTTAQNPEVQTLYLDSQTHYRVGKGTAPALSSCGSSPSILGTDAAGQVTMGGTATGCVITFNYPYTNAPFCVVTWQATPLASQSYSVSPTAITLTQTSTSNDVINYHCMAQNGG